AWPGWGGSGGGGWGAGGLGRGGGGGGWSGCWRRPGGGGAAGSPKAGPGSCFPRGGGRATSLGWDASPSRASTGTTHGVAGGAPGLGARAAPVPDLADGGRPRGRLAVRPLRHQVGRGHAPGGAAPGAGGPRLAGADSKGGGARPAGRTGAAGDRVNPQYVASP